MSTLHERLLRWFDVGAPDGDLEDAIAREEAALRAVVELHTPRPCNCKDARHVICDGCPGHAARCVTLATIAGPLGVEIGDTPK